MSAGHLIVAYHGCDVVIRDALVRGDIKHLDISKNRYDWLGPGSYFFEDDPDRAMIFSKASRDHPERRYTARPIATPAVVGAILRVQHWLDMTTQAGIQEFAGAYKATVNGITTAGGNVPVNTVAHPEDTDIIYRALDNAIFTFIHSYRADPANSLSPYQAVRGAFPQGNAVVENSGFRSNTHIQIALRENKCVVGWFLPHGESLLSVREYSRAKARLEAAKAKGKPKVKAPTG